MFDRRYFVVCPSFHGATLLAKLLNAHPSVVALGDTYPKNTDDEICGCGDYVRACDFWQRVGASVTGRPGEAQAFRYTLYPRIRGGSRDKLIYLQSSPSRLARVVPPVARDQFLNEYWQYMAGIARAENRGGGVFIDGVKSLSRVKALWALDPVAVNGVIHLVRRPGDFSKSRSRKVPGLAAFARSNLIWRSYHRMAATLSNQVPYLRVHYDDLTRDADSVLGAVFDFVNVPHRPVSTLIDNFDPNWHFLGNASLRKFDGRILASRHGLTSTERVISSVLSGETG